MFFCTKLQGKNCACRGCKSKWSSCETGKRPEVFELKKSFKPDEMSAPGEEVVGLGETWSIKPSPCETGGKMVVGLSEGERSWSNSLGLVVVTAGGTKGTSRAGRFDVTMVGRVGRTQALGWRH